MRHFAKITTCFHLLLLPFLTPSTTLAQAGSPIGQTCPRDDDGNIIGCYADLTQLETVFANVLNAITVLAGLAVLLVLVIGAFRYIVAQGDPKAIASARSHITWAFIGLFFIIAAWFVILFLAQFTGVNLINFCIPLIDGTPCPTQLP